MPQSPCTEILSVFPGENPLGSHQEPFEILSFEVWFILFLQPYNSTWLEKRIVAGNKYGQKQEIITHNLIEKKWEKSVKCMYIRL